MGPAGETRMACPDPGAAETERRFLGQPGAVVKFGFMAGRLMLMEEGGRRAAILSPIVKTRENS